jgi:hypothetical protein
MTVFVNMGAAVLKKNAADLGQHPRFQGESDRFFRHETVLRTRMARASLPLRTSHAEKNVLF